MFDTYRTERLSCDNIELIIHIHTKPQTNNGNLSNKIQVQVSLRYKIKGLSID